MTTLFLAGDVMTGRGVDQILAYPGDPELHEPYVQDARRYVALAEQANGRIPRPVNHRYVWGFALPLLESIKPTARIINLHGHSSHHVKGIEVYHRRLILYGCGDLLTDYEGIPGNEAYRGDLGLLYFPELEAGTGRIMELNMQPTQVRQMQLQRPRLQDVTWLEHILNREGTKLGTQVSRSDDGRLYLQLDA